MLERLETKLDDIYRENGAPVVVIGHSLGGLYARELGHRHPEQIERVITLGAPASHPLDSCNTTLNVLADCIAAISNRWKECVMGACSCGTALQMHRMPPVPVTAIYSRTDGIVDWKGCIGESGSASLDHVEVMGSHFGMTLSPDVFRIVAERLTWPRQQPRDPATSAPKLRLISRRMPAPYAAASRASATPAAIKLQFAAPVKRAGQGGRVAVLEVASRRQSVCEAGGLDSERLE
jgi:pimeloyl-ACP methyl ester carboxylesterase